MKQLKVFVEQENRWSAVLGRPELDLRSATDRQEIANSIDSALSPENLSCDGELSRAETTRRYNALTKAAEQLLKLDPTVRFYEYA